MYIQQLYIEDDVYKRVVVIVNRLKFGTISSYNVYNIVQPKLHFRTSQISTENKNKTQEKLRRMR